VAALVWRLSVHPAQQVGAWTYTELSVGYVAKAADVGRETARQAWHLVRECLGWFSVGLRRAQALGAQVRRLAPGGRWGQHLLLTDDAAAAADQVAADRDLGPTRQALPDGPDWQPLAPTRRGRHLMACCPWHDDTTPSMLLNVNADGCSGSGVCFGCTDDQGRPLRVYWRRHGDAWRARPARAIVGVCPAVRSSGTIDNPGPAPTAPSVPGRHLLATLDQGRGMRRRASQCADLLDLLRHADRRSATDRAAGQAAADHWREQGPGDAYVSVEPMAPVAWRTLDTRRGPVRVPDRWEPTEARWLLADLDGFTDGPVGDNDLAAAAQALERWAQREPALSGRVGVVRTSHLGVQVVAELAQAQPDPRRWHGTAQAQALARGLDAAALVAARAAGFVGGHADQCVHAAGRLMRRPGWRLDKRGDLCRARLVYASQKESQP
jgi:hypothetical protein